MKEAMHCEARKTSYRQTSQGVVISFLLHPSDIPDGLSLAPLGTRFMLAVCEIGDDERAVAPKEKTPRSFHDMSFTQQAGMLCTDTAFKRFLTETLLMPDDNAVAAVKGFCGVASRKDILPNTEAASKWVALVSDYRAWQHEPEHI